MRFTRRRATIAGATALTGITLVSAVLGAVSRPEPTGAPPGPASTATPTPAPAPAGPSGTAPATSPTGPERWTTPAGRLHAVQPAGGPAGPSSTGPRAPGDPPEARPPADDPVLIEGALQTPDTLPPGVREQVDFFLGGGPECWEAEPGGPSVGMQSKPIIPTQFLLCFLGFRDDRPLRVTVTPPVGRPVTRTVPPQETTGGGVFLPWPILPSDRAGTYRVTASQGGRTASRSFAISRPATPRIWLDRGHEQIDHSVDLHLYFAGFPRGGTVDFTLYREERFFSTFRVRADALGGGHAVIRTGNDLPDACWGVTHPVLAGGPNLDVFCTYAEAQEPGGE
ncbi:hypothetical protein [Actinoplanes sp. NBRC 103695]|uniref:hypothetical protein n=1 Tax=Actinoplanes sp. NBRC 103695 TaxID=3032202 RepID=UPI0024A2E623|nr:hypothetical protein [Actinoplanes sp. NBRC 103695]GLZ00325.1 hypothetical protein Acsp02_75770 [Actinoplanes sp. NBRC 103695]